MTAHQATTPRQITSAGLQRDAGVIGAERRPRAVKRVLATRPQPFLAEDYATLGDAFFEDATEAGRLGATRAAETYLRRARACWWIARQLRPERTDHAQP